MANHPASAIVWGRCARCGFSEEDHVRLKDDDDNEWAICPPALGSEFIDWSQTYDEEQAGDEIG